MNKYSNVIRVVSTGHEFSVLWQGVMIDVEQFLILSCDIDPEKGMLTYDVNLAARKLAFQAGIKFPPASKNVHISSLSLVTELELELMKERGVDVIVDKKLVCHRRIASCDPAKDPAGGCAGCRELRRRVRNQLHAA